MLAELPGPHSSAAEDSLATARPNGFWELDCSRVMSSRFMCGPIAIDGMIMPDTVMHVYEVQRICRVDAGGDCCSLLATEFCFGTANHGTGGDV